MLNLFKPRLVVIVTKSGVRTKVRGTIRQIDTFTDKLHDYITQHADASDKTNKRILNGQWDKKLEDAPNAE